MNNRKAIRTALKTLLDGETSAGSNVYTNRETNLWKSELPSILIYTSQEQAEPEASTNRRYIRTLQLQIKAKVEASLGVDDGLDDLVAEIEAVLDTHQSISGTVYAALLTNTDTSVDAEGEQDVGVAVLTYECKYIS